MKKNRKIKFVPIVILIIGIIAIIGSTVLRYNIEPNEIYRIDSENLIEDGSFENFNQSAGDCCNAEPDKSLVYASKSIDSVVGVHSLNLTSKYQCACIAKPILDFDRNYLYLVSLSYKGQNPRLCVWAGGDQKCLINNNLDKRLEWGKYFIVVSYTDISLNSNIVLYADSRDGKTYTNLYDDLQVRRLIEIENQSEYQFNPEEEYVIKTKADNRVVGEMISDVGDDGRAYFLVRGKPIVTLQFPWSEIVLVVIMLIVVIRLLFKRDDDEIL